MTNKDKILYFLRKTKGCYDDDYLSDKLNIKPRQSVNQICRNLCKQGVILRRKGICSLCGRRKFLNSYIGKEHDGMKKLLCPLCGSPNNLIVKTLIRNVMVKLPISGQGRDIVADTTDMHLDPKGFDTTWEWVECSKCGVELYEIKSQEDLLWTRRKRSKKNGLPCITLKVPKGIIKAPIRNGVVITKEAVLMLFISSGHSTPKASL
jgi:predicted transcriptional regulator